MTMLTRDQIDATFAAFMAKDLNAVMQMFAEDAILIDPHYPQQRMIGKAAIERGLTWGLGIGKARIFHLVIWINGDSATVEVDTEPPFRRRYGFAI